MRSKPYQPKDFEDFWTSRIEGWLLSDIDTCVKYNVNIGAATLIFCYIDFFGSLIRPDLKDNSRQRFYEFCDQYLDKMNSNYVSFKCKLYDDFRCGLAHEAIMKKGTGIFRSDDKADQVYNHFCFEDGALFLDLIQLRDDLFSAVRLLKKDIDSDPRLKTKAVARLRDLKWALPKE